MSASPDLARLRAAIATLDGGEGAAHGALPLGLAPIDAHLPGFGLAFGALHEIGGGDGPGRAAAAAFAAMVLGRAAVRRDRPVLWIGAGAAPYAPGLAAFGLPPERLVMVGPLRPAQAAWAMEEGVRCPALAAVLAEGDSVDPVAARRLHLAARTSGVMGILLAPRAACVTALTRWRVGPAPSRAALGGGVGAWRWRLELLRARGRALDEDGRVGSWTVEWDDDACGLRLVAPAGDRTAAPHRRRAAG